MLNDFTSFEKHAEEVASIIRASRSALIVAHIDADGITSAAIASIALDRLGMKHEVKFLKKLGEEDLNAVLQEDFDCYWFVDLGSGLFSKMTDKCVVTDHHRPDILEKERHLNPHLFGIDGSTEISGSGVTYVVAKTLGDNKDLSSLAVVGAIGDFQESSCSRLIGYNKKIVEDAVNYAGVRAEIDIRIFGKQTRQLPSLLQYASDPKIIEYITNHVDDRESCIKFLSEAGIQQENGPNYWYELTRSEKARIVDALVNKMIEHGCNISQIRRMIGETYTLPENLVNAPSGWLSSLSPYDRVSARALFDAKEFSTLLNACGRHELPDVGMKVCKGDRETELMRALGRQYEHRESLKGAIELVKLGESNGIKESIAGKPLRNIRYFNGGEKIKDTILGTITGMLLNNPEMRCSDKPLVSFSEVSDGTGTLKVSSRGTKELVEKGLDLSVAMSKSSQKCGGSGGGHNIAAGAAIPRGKEREFLEELDAIVGSQINGE